MQEPEAQRVKRSQRDYSLAFKLAVVGEVARGELSKKQAERRYGIQGRSTVLAWCRKYATHFVTFQQAGSTSPSPIPAVEQTPEQRIKQLETQFVPSGYMLTLFFKLSCENPKCNELCAASAPASILPCIAKGCINAGSARLNKRHGPSTAVPSYPRT